MIKSIMFENYVYIYKDIIFNIIKYLANFLLIFMT